MWSSDIEMKGTVLGLRRVREKPAAPKNSLSYRNDVCTMNSNGGSSAVGPTRGIENYGVAEKRRMTLVRKQWGH